ncbi:MAG: Grx4 family monothiol glutaredoxin [Solirubrobacterales bacterium]
MADNELRDHLAKLINDNEVILFMKGNPDAPACGFSARAVAVLNSLGKRYAAVDILPDPRIREELTAISEWPTIPQLFVDGELVGGCDIMMEMYESGELADTLGVEQPVDEDDDPAEAVATPQPQGLQLENRLD